MIDIFWPISAFWSHRSQPLKLHQPIVSYRTEMYLSIHQWQESHAEANWSYFPFNYSNIAFQRREWHLFYDLLSFGFSSYIRLNETILYHSTVVITPNFDICLVFGSVCHCVTRLDPDLSVCVSTCSSMCVSLSTVTFGHLFPANRNPSICLSPRFPSFLTHFLWRDSSGNKTTALKIRRGIYS